MAKSKKLNKREIKRYNNAIRVAKDKIDASKIGQNNFLLVSSRKEDDQCLQISLYCQTMSVFYFYDHPTNYVVFYT